MADDITPGAPPAGLGTPTKTCPSCAEQVQQAAQVCRYCGYDFNAGIRPAPVTTGGDTNGKAIASLVFGILWMFGLGSILAVVLGHMAKREIDRSGGRQGGRGIAVAGLILGWLGVAGIIGFILLTAGLFAATDAAIDEGLRSDMESSLKNAATAQESYATSRNGRYTSNINDLYAEGFSPGLATVTIVEADSEGYCMEAESEGEVMRFDSEESVPTEGSC